MNEPATDDQAGKKLLDVLKREEKVILSGEWHKLAPLGRLRTRLWRALEDKPHKILEPTLQSLRDQNDVNTRLLARALAEVGEQISVHRRRARVSAVYRKTGTDLA